MRNVLIIAGIDEQYYFGPFLEACAGRGLALFVFDPSRFPHDAAVNVQMDRAGIVSGFMEVQQWEDGTFSRARLSLTDVHVAWYLRETSTTPPPDDSVASRFAENESRAAVRSLWSVLDCAWVNRPETLHFLASNKLFQQRVAAACGLRTPRTLVSNDPKSVATFSDPKEGLLLKSIGYIRLDEQREYFLYSERFSHVELLEGDNAIRRCPIFAQEYVNKRYEHRVMAIGKRVLSCRIDSQASDATKVDWRHYDFEKVEHVAVELPAPVQARLLRFMEVIGLRYGAIDLIETPDGEFVFLEVNPSGQWGWIADFARLPIAAAVADMLEQV